LHLQHKFDSQGTSFGILSRLQFRGKELAVIGFDTVILKTI